jgi:hypothetical protein
MVEISLSGSGEGLGRVTGRGYSTAAFRAIMRPITPDRSTTPGASGPARGEHAAVETHEALLPIDPPRSTRHRRVWLPFRSA